MVLYNSEALMLDYRMYQSTATFRWCNDTVKSQHLVCTGDYGRVAQAFYTYW